MFNKKIDTKADIHELIAARWSGRAYDPERLLTDEQIVSLIEAARWAPSCFGDQPWRFIVFNKAGNRSSWDKAVDCLAAGNHHWAVNAPVLFLAVANLRLSKNDALNRWGEYDTGAAAENLCLQAMSLGLMAHQMGGFESEEARAVFNIPEQHNPMAMIAVGYQLRTEAIPEDIKEREYGQRSRAPISDNFFNGCWDVPMLPDI